MKCSYVLTSEYVHWLLRVFLIPFLPFTPHRRQQVDGNMIMGSLADKKTWMPVETWSKKTRGGNMNPHHIPCIAIFHSLMEKVFCSSCCRVRGFPHESTKVSSNR
mmetsp:Transcript_3853/g.8684  ORF Transcript_3853/g.8684 Transcript_3853/m.8684 type:complete len:105 (+) Transcript_3853:564-878(+)